MTFEVYLPLRHSLTVPGEGKAIAALLTWQGFPHNITENSREANRVYPPGNRPVIRHGDKIIIGFFQLVNYLNEQYLCRLA